MLSKTIPESALLSKLENLGLHFIISSNKSDFTESITTEELIAGLAQNKDARIHSALIAILLYRPQFADAIPNALKALNTAQQTRLKLFYSAAMLLQRIYSLQLRQYIADWQILPDLFSKALSINDTHSFERQLQQLGYRHRELSGITANWSGSYQNTAIRLMTRLEKEKTWAI